MSMSTSTAIPEELLQAILVRLDDSVFGWKYQDVSKHGLTACSLTCRYWAKLVRPLLFARLTLRSREDDTQLQAFLATPDFLGRSIGDSIVMLRLIYNGPPSGIPWTLLRPTQSLISRHVEIHVEWRMAGGEGRAGQKWPTYLLSRVLPRTPPPSGIHCIRRLELCNLSLSVRDFLRFIRLLRFEALDMENVTFGEGEDPALLPALPAPPLADARSLPLKQCFIRFRRCSKSALLFWTIIGGFIFSGQRLQMNNSGLAASISRQLSRFADIHTDSGTYDLFITAAVHHEGLQIFRPCHYHLHDGRRILAIIATKTMRTGAVHICSIDFLCPDLENGGSAVLDQLCLSLSNSVRCAVVYKPAENMHTLLCDVLEGRVLADPSVSHVFLKTGFWTASGHAVRDIKAAPAEMVLHNGATVPLTTMQRARWLNCDKRESYLADLRRDVTDPEREHGQKNTQYKPSHT